MPNISVGVLRNVFNFNICKLVKTFYGYRYAHVDNVRCSDSGVAKYVALSKFDNLRDNVPVVISSKGVHYYYHYKYRKWFKDLDDNQLSKYFYWLSA